MKHTALDVFSGFCLFFGKAGMPGWTGVFQNRSDYSPIVTDKVFDRNTIYVARSMSDADVRTVLFFVRHLPLTYNPPASTVLVAMTPEVTDFSKSQDRNKRHTDIRTQRNICRQ